VLIGRCCEVFAFYILGARHHQTRHTTLADWLKKKKKKAEEEAEEEERITTRLLSQLQRLLLQVFLFPPSRSLCFSSSLLQ
jgi:hypothetical protein